MNSLRQMIGGDELIEAPAVFNPLSAKLAEASGFPAIYLGGGALGYLQCGTEANLSLPEMVRVGIDIRTVCPLPLILDGGGGGGDPMHVRYFMSMVEAAGFAGIEIEDQVLPKRAHHHVGIEHMIAQELMAAKITEAARARRNGDFIIIARTNAAKSGDLDDALRRGEAYRKAGADMLFVSTRCPEHIRVLGERLPHPLVALQSDSSLRRMGITKSDLSSLGFRLLTDPSSAIMMFHKAMSECYRAIARGEAGNLFGSAGPLSEQPHLHRTIGLEEMLAIERATVEG